jgi:hypothetical protein
MRSFSTRIILAAKLDSSVYREVESDPTAMGQAMGVVALSSIAAGLGSIQEAGISGIFFGALTALVSWFVWAFLTYFIGTRVLPTPQTRADYGELLRTIGFSSAPGMIRILAIVPGLRGIVFLAAGTWMLLAMVIAVREALDYASTWRAVGVCVIGWIVQFLIIGVLLTLTGVHQEVAKP